MKAGISTATLFRRLYNEDALALFQEWGVETAEVFLTSFCEYEPSFARTLLDRKGDLNVSSFHVLNTQFEPQLYTDHPRTKADAYMWLEKALSSAQILGAKRYTFHGIARIKRTFKEDIPRVAEITEEIAQCCKKFGVSLCYENVEWAFFNRPEIFRELKARCPSLMGVLDIKQARISGYDYRDYLSEMGGAISHVHVSDIDETGKMCLPGRGTFDFDELLKRLQGVGFQGAVLIENYAGDYSDLGQLKASYEFLAEKPEKYSK
ncbi:MAG: sugar phosphate isomerase/epimerase [Clostridiales bacterium]|nr:sugar phosphate isomerase/epimerase [Clostridiales bacterium]